MPRRRSRAIKAQSKKPLQHEEIRKNVKALFRNKENAFVVERVSGSLSLDEGLQVCCSRKRAVLGRRLRRGLKVQELPKIVARVIVEHRQHVKVLESISSSL